MMWLHSGLGRTERTERGRAGVRAERKRAGDLTGLSGREAVTVAERREAVTWQRESVGDSAA